MRISRQRHRPLNTTARLLVKRTRCPEYDPGLYTVSELDQMVFVDGYIPVANAAELDKIRTGASETMGAGTCWEGTYTTGLDKNYVQVGVCDFSVSSITNWSPFQGFSGILDGNEISIHNFYSTTNGLFGTNNTACTIKNIRLHGHVNASGNIKGLLIGQATVNDIIIENCLVNGRVDGGSNVGGFVGVNRGHISNCSFSGEVNGTDHVGGFVGNNNSGGLIEFSSSYSNVIFTGAGVAIGGTFAGRQQTSTSVIRKCKSNGNIVHAGSSSTDRICGGFIGVSNNGSLIEDCMAIGTATGRSRVGGFAGQLSGSNHVRCYCAVTVSGDGTFVGGYSNRIELGGNTIEDCYFDVDVSGIPDTLAAEPRTTIQMQEGTEDSYILPGGGIDGGSNPDNLMYNNWNPLIWDFGTSSEYPKLINTP